MTLQEAAKVLIEYNKWRRLQIKETKNIRDNITPAIKKVSSFLFWNQEEIKILKPHASIFDTYLKFRSGGLEQEPVGFATKIGESIEFVSNYILKEVHD